MAGGGLGGIAPFFSDICLVGISSRALGAWRILRAWNADFRGFNGFSRIFSV
ncbi:MAG: hypothetical protein FWG87_12215 [Defluviitaleaceae bacterium]|nr:hypothetical protein [Defluviitaleaceae bacterium]